MIGEAFSRNLKDSRGTQNVDYVILYFVDLLGLLKGRTIPASELEDAVERGVGFDGSSIPGCVGIEESDMVMKPDPSTTVLLPHYLYNSSDANVI